MLMNEQPEQPKKPLKDAFARETVEPRILIMDIERTPAHARIWSQKVNFSPVGNWVKLPETICMASKWYESKRVMFSARWESDDPHYLARQVWKLFDEATHIVGYNSKLFDERHCNTLFVEAGLPKPRPYKSIDIYQVNKSQFGFESKSLRHLCERLGVVNKDGHYSATDAEAAMAGDVKAQRRLSDYNKADVIATEAVLTRLLPWIKGINLGLYYGTDDTPRCPNCGKTNTLEPAGWASTAVTRYACFRCNECGAVARNNHRKHSTTIRGVN